MTPAQIEQRERMRNAALRSYAQMHDRWSQEEQRLAGGGRITYEAGEVRVYEAEGARAYARLVLRAWLAERDDPAPEGLSA